MSLVYQERHIVSASSKGLLLVLFYILTAVFSQTKDTPIPNIASFTEIRNRGPGKCIETGKAPHNPPCSQETVAYSFKHEMALLYWMPKFS